MVHHLCLSLHRVDTQSLSLEVHDHSQGFHFVLSHLACTTKLLFLFLPVLTVFLGARQGAIRAQKQVVDVTSSPVCCGKNNFIDIFHFIS